MKIPFTTTLLVAAWVMFGEVAQGQIDLSQTQTGAPGQAVGGENFLIQRDTGGFIGGNSGAFIGGAGNDTAATVGALGALGRTGAFGGLGGLGRGNQFGLPTQGNTASAEPQIRFRLTLGFAHPGRAPSQVSSQFTQRLTRLPSIPSAESVIVTVEDRTAVLAGAVESERERMLIERLALMEPGVWAVRNELTVEAAPDLLPGPTN